MSEPDPALLIQLARETRWPIEEWREAHALVKGDRRLWRVVPELSHAWSLDPTETARRLLAMVDHS